MIVIGFIILGGVALTRLPLALLPEMNLPAAVVITNYENVGPREIETQVTRPIEEIMATVSNVTRVRSTSSPGVSQVVVEFDWGTDMDFAALEMREQLDLVRAFLPDGVEQPQVFRFDPSMQPIFQFNVGGMDDPSLLRQFVDDELKNRLERVEGVAQVNVSGGLEREVRVEVDQARLEAWGLSIQQVAQALGAGNLNLPGGRISGHDRELQIRTVGEFVDVDEIRQTVVSAGPGGVVRVGDVARVVDGFKETQLISRLNGAPSIAVTLQREAGANTVVVSDRIRAELEALEAVYGDQVVFQIVWDEAEFIRFSIQGVVENAFTGALIAMVVLLVFLRSFGATLIVGSAVPVAGIATFFFLYLMDVSLNILSLGGLALGVGMLVDNAIVSLENIVRHKQMGKSAIEAAIDGTKEVAAALGASTLTTMAVFLPIVFVGGMAAEIFRDLSYAVVFSLFMSLVVAITFVPMVASRTKISVPIDEDVIATNTGAAGPASGGVEQKQKSDFFIRMRQAYADYLHWILHKRWVAVATVAALSLSALLLWPKIGQEFLPSTDTGEIGVRIRMPYGSTSEQTDAVIREIEAYVAQLPDVETVYAAVGGRDGMTSESGIMHVGLVSRKERQMGTARVVEAIREFGNRFPEAEVRAAIQDPFGMEEAGGAPLVVKVSGSDQEELRLVGERIAELIAGISGTRDVELSTRTGRPELQVVVDRERAATYGLSVAQIASSLRSAVDGVVATRYRPDGTGTEIDVRVQLASEWRDDVGSIERVLVPTPLGTAVPLWEVARVEEGIAPVAVEREDQVRVVSVTAQLVGRDLSSVTADVRKAMANFPLPGDVRWEFGGDAIEMEEAFDSLGFALVLAVILVYMIMAAQFESFVHPFVIMFSVPLGFIGVVWGLVLTGRAMSVPALIGVILLAGIVVNNGIVMIDYVNQLRAAGRSRLEALVTGSATRLRPVLMTAFTTILGMFPLALGLGEGQELAAPIATVVMGGLFVSTILTLGFVPVAYSLFDDLGAWVSARAGTWRIGSRKGVGAAQEAADETNRARSPVEDGRPRDDVVQRGGAGELPAPQKD